MSDLLGIGEAADGLKQTVKAGQSLQNSMDELLKFAEQIDKSRYNAKLRGKKIRSSAQQALYEFKQKQAIKEMETAIRKQILETYGKDGLNDFEQLMKDIDERRKKADAQAKHERIVGRIMLWVALSLASTLVWYVQFRSQAVERTSLDTPAKTLQTGVQKSVSHLYAMQMVLAPVI
jgi:RNase P/RNase MRP subunit POP5